MGPGGDVIVLNMEKAIFASLLDKATPVFLEFFYFTQ
jgi:hypothetical protein